MFSLIIPAYNEEHVISETIKLSKDVLALMGIKYEIIVVDDGSVDKTFDTAKNMDVIVLRHPQNIGYGAALKTGILMAKYDWVAIVDGDGTYPINEFPALWDHIPIFDMVVGARKGEHYWGSVFKQPARKLFLWLSEFVTGRHIPDVNSGMRIFRRNVVMTYLDTVSSGFSFTTTITLAMLLDGRFVKYVPISYHDRIGRSHVRYIRDTLRTGQIIVQAILFYNPIKLFLLIAMATVIFSFIVGGFTLINGFVPALIIAWVGICLAIIIFSMGLLADTNRTKRLYRSYDRNQAKEETRNKAH